MTWTKLSDDFADDCWTLTAEAFRLHVEGLCWSNRKLLDLRIPKTDLARFAKDTAAVAELVSVGWWTDDGDHLVIRHHACYQRPREQALAIQARNVENGMKGGRPPKPKPPKETQMETQMETQGDGPGQEQHLGKEVAQNVEPDDKPDPDPALPHRCSSCSARIRHRNGMCTTCSDAVIAANSPPRSEPSPELTETQPSLEGNDDDPDREFRRAI